MIIDHIMQKSGVAFGTSGARGLVKDMTDSVCYAYTTGFIKYLESIQDFTKSDKIMVSGDLRTSSERISKAVIQSIKDNGYEPIYCGNIPTPAVMLYGLMCNCPSIMITGSHIPDDRNGIKFNKSSGEILKEDEEGIRRQSVNLVENLKIDPLPKINSSAEEHYRKRYIDLLPSNYFEGLKIGVYQHSSVSRGILVDILSYLGADITKLNYSDTFIPVDTEAIRDQDIDLAKIWSKEYNLDVIVSTDGDGDRPLISDENGNWIPGDIVGILTSMYLNVDSVSTPVSSNTALELCNHFNHINRTKIGSPYVIESMIESSKKYKKVVGYEANGGFLTNSILQINNRAIEALPTRDAILPILCILIMCKESNLKISELLQKLPNRYTMNKKINNFLNEDSLKILNLYSDIENVEKDFSLDFGMVDSINNLDGVRIKFKSGDIIHFRASGNAPELRLYHESNSIERVSEISNISLTHILRRNV